MHVCMLSELFYPYMLGGAERRYFEIAKRLAKRNEVTVYSLKFYGTKDEEEKDGIRIIRTGMKHPLNKRSMLPLASYLPSLMKSLGNFDIVDSNQGISSFAG